MFSSQVFPNARMIQMFLTILFGHYQRMANSLLSPTTSISLDNLKLLSDFHRSIFISKRHSLYSFLCLGSYLGKILTIIILGKEGESSGMAIHYASIMNTLIIFFSCALSLETVGFSTQSLQPLLGIWLHDCGRSLGWYHQ